MKLLLVHHAWPPESLGGSERYTLALARALAVRHDVTVLHRSADGARPDYDLRESRRDGLHVVALNNLHRELPGFEAYRDPRAAAAAMQVLEREQPALVHVGHLTGLSTAVVFEARRRGVPVALTLHDFWTVCVLGQLLNLRLEVCPGPTPRRCLGCVGAQVASAPAGVRAAGRRVPLAGLLGRMLSRVSRGGAQRVADRLAEMGEVLRAADLLISPSRFLRERLLALGAPPIEVLENGHEPLELPPRQADPQGGTRFGFVGAAIPSKGVHVLAEAFRRLDDPRATLAIHGPFVPYHGDSGYERRVRRVLGPLAGAALRGPFSPQNLGRVLAELDVLVVPSIWEENSPLSIQEAFLAGLPVIASDHGGLAEKVRHDVDGLRFRPADPADLARVMRRFLNEPGLAARLSLARPAVPGMDEHVAALEDLYERAQQRFRTRAGRVGVVVLDRARPLDAAAAAHSALDVHLAPRVLVVENGPGPEPVVPPGVSLLEIPENRGYAAGMNAGIAALRTAGCDRILLLNNDATLEPGCLRRLAESLEDRHLAAVGPQVVGLDGRVESRGAEFDVRWGRYRLRHNLARDRPAQGLESVRVLSGAVWMLSVRAWERVGPLDERYFHSFEDVDWCLRAREAGLELAVLTGVRAVHAGARTLGIASPDRLYYALRNHLHLTERLLPLAGLLGFSRRATILVRYLAYALRQRDIPLEFALAALRSGWADSRGNLGPRPESP